MSNEARYEILLNWWAVGQEDHFFDKLPQSLQNELLSTDEPPDDVLDEKYDPLIFEALRSQYVGVKNEYLASKISQILNTKQEVEGLQEELIVCPCCQYKTLSSRGEYDICPVCFWEDDGTIETSDHSSPNRMTLAQGRLNFAHLGVVSTSVLHFVELDRFDKYSKSFL
ncbi:hypothetical protein B5M42_004925 [Paenibacillus athensensis]|uniref:Cysteine-rich CPCC domain-containing protein n=2 Tax=Paenibacillus athensensis TaxID=1967502 RepID=A0A4Y8PW63_9BACL|nr:hypothetical protein [Paenibacillus athensensis]